MISFKHDDYVTFFISDLKLRQTRCCFSNLHHSAELFNNAFFLHFATESFVNTIYRRQRDDRLNTKINLQDDFTKVNAIIYALFLDNFSRNLHYTKNIIMIYEKESNENISNHIC